MRPPPGASPPGTMELSPASGGAEALSWPEMFSGLESDSPLPPEDLDAAVPVGGAVAGGMLDRILLESVCQQQGWVRVYGKDRAGPSERPVFLPFGEADIPCPARASPALRPPPPPPVRFPRPFWSRGPPPLGPVPPGEPPGRALSHSVWSPDPSGSGQELKGELGSADLILRR